VWGSARVTMRRFLQLKSPLDRDFSGPTGAL